MGKRDVLTRYAEQRRGTAVSLDSFRLMQRPELRKLTSSAAAVLRCADASRRERLKMRRRRGKMKRLTDPIYKERSNSRARKSRRPKNDYLAARMPRSSRWLLKIRIY